MKNNTVIGKLAHPETMGRAKPVDDIISIDRLEKFVNRTFHWKGLTTSDQMKMAKELLLRRQSDD
jgi:hypothetical protein